MEESYIWSRITDYYGETKYNGTPQSIRDDRMIFNKPFRRWYIAPAAVIFQAICGSVYTWSVFNRPIDVAIYGSDQVTCQCAYYGCLLPGSRNVQGVLKERGSCQTNGGSMDAMHLILIIRVLSPQCPFLPLFCVSNRPACCAYLKRDERRPSRKWRPSPSISTWAI